MWFFGCTPDLCTIVWVGREFPQHIGYEATGGSIAVPIWTAFNQSVQKAYPERRSRRFPVSDDASLMPLEDGRFVPFARGKMPTRYFRDVVDGAASIAE